MLSYQHAYHAGNLADVQKHALLAWALDYLTAKDKPLTYIETHAGRGLYDLTSAEAVKTGEAAAGVTAVEGWFAPDHPYRRILTRVRARSGATAYPGSPLVAALSLRPMDTIRLAELHPAEHQALTEAMADFPVEIVKQDGLDFALAIAPPTPRRGMMLIDPSYEVKTDYDRIPKVMAQIAKKWNVGILALWYPILIDVPHRMMLATLRDLFPDLLVSEIRFPAARDGHRMVGSGMVFVNAPYGLDAEAARLSARFVR
jgi:23S rRNA (adenine2030-N6)-methyltransferase